MKTSMLRLMDEETVVDKYTISTVHILDFGWEIIETAIQVEGYDEWFVVDQYENEAAAIQGHLAWCSYCDLKHPVKIYDILDKKEITIAE